jgi:hypothetical protein
VERLLERVELGPFASDSTVSISAPSACTASVRHERAGRPSSSTVQAPQTPCSQPTWVPVEVQLVPDEVGEQQSGLDELLVLHPRSP